MAETVRFQHFEIPRREDGSLHELGRGAMGITYKAFDTNLRCFAALKVINAAYLQNDTARQRFLREARAAAALRHPNVATVFYLGEEGGDCFYAMEFVDGETVEALMKREGAIPAATALQITLQVARALGAAQKQSLVHRDIKPSNLMLVRDDDNEITVKVIDFGLAKNAGGAGAEDSATLTLAGFLGTPHFASPEQLEEAELDGRSDIYSLGVTLYYMLAGRVPFSGSLAQVMSQHLHREPPLDLLSGQPPCVIDLLHHMLAKDPAARPQTPADLRRKIEACLATLKSAGEGSASAGAVADENFDTQAMDAVGAAVLEPATGVVLAGRYRIEREVTASDHGRVFCAESLETSTLVALLMLDPALIASREACTRIEEQVENLRALDSPALQKVFSLERFEHLSFLTLEWIEGPTLLELMRIRRALPTGEAMGILHALEPGFHSLQVAGLPCPDISAHEIVLVGGDVARVLGEWKNFRAVFNPLAPGLPGGMASGATLVTSNFSILESSGAFATNTAGAFVYVLAALAYEMMGGVRSGAARGGPVPIPGISEAANAALRRALTPAESFPTTAEFLGALGDGDSLPPVPPRPPAVASPVPAREVPPTLPAPGRRAPAPVFVATGLAILVLLAVAAGVVTMNSLRQKQAPPPISLPMPPPAATPTPAVVVATPTPTPAALPTPGATPDPLAVAWESALRTEKTDPAASLTALLAVLKSAPGQPKVRDAVEQWVQTLRTSKLTPGQVAALRQPLESAAASNVVAAEILLGEELRQSDPSGSLKWFLSAAEHGDAEAMLQSALMLSNKHGTLPADLPLAAQWFKQAADLGNAAATFSLAECYLYGFGVTRDPENALELLKSAVEKNEPRAMNLLGDQYKRGIPGVLEPDFQKAFELFSDAKDLDFLDAQGNLAVLYITGKGVAPDAKMALDLFRDGAERGNPLCMFNYAQCLEGGVGGNPPDLAAAREWYVKAAQQGITKAQDWCKKNRVPYKTPPPPGP